MKIEELVGSLRTYEFSLPQPKKNKSIVLVYFNWLHFVWQKRFHNKDTVILEELLQNINSNMERAEQGSICTE
jgi:hypothetical protein